jgi:molybdate transport system substrate-binding protein
MIFRVLFLGLAMAGARAETLTIAAASDLVHCLGELQAAFVRVHPGVECKTTTGASGNLFAQIRHGAPFDVFLSADVHYPEELIKAGLAEESSLTPYAVGRLVVWTVRDGVDVTAGLAALRHPAVRRIAIANPDHAPYGRAARAALGSAGLWEAVQPRLVFGENSAQTAQFVETQNADAGIVALAIVLSPRLQHTGRWAAVPESAHPPLEQVAVLTKRGARGSAGWDYLKFLRSPAAREIFRRHGFRLPEP